MNATSPIVERDASDHADEPTLLIGSVLDGKYVIERVLGRGGMSTVYEARHATVGHRVAIKVVKAESVDRLEKLDRFQREAKICGTIRHPNVGQVYDVGALQDGTPFMVLELHEGQSLEDVLDDSAPPIPVVLHIALQLLAALAAVHDAGVVHRDIKPGNIMLVRDLHGDLVVKLVDFGISKLMRADIRERTLTRAGTILGSPDYMAPEQLRGQPVDERSDLYAIGALLYQAVTGETPFDGDTLSDLMVAVLRDPVTPPRHHSADCPIELERTIMKALRRAPEERFQTAQEMARELEQIQSALRRSGDGTVSLPMPLRTERSSGTRRAISAASTEASAPTVMIEKLVPRKRSYGSLLALCALAVLALFLAPSLFEEKADASRPSVLPLASPARTTLAVAPSPTLLLLVPDAAPQVASMERLVEPPFALKRAPRAVTALPNAVAPISPAPISPAPIQTPQPAQPEVHALLRAATAAFVLGQMPSARSLYQQAIERSPAEADAWRGLALVASRMGQRQDAENALTRYLALRPNAPDAARIREQLAKVR